MFEEEQKQKRKEQQKERREALKQAGICGEGVQVCYFTRTTAEVSGAAETAVTLDSVIIQRYIEAQRGL